MSFLLMAFLAAVCLAPTYPEPLWGGPRWLAALLTAAAVLLAVGHAALVALQVRRPLEANPSLLNTQMARYDRWRTWHSLVTLGLYAASLWLFGWGWAVRSLYGPEKGPGAEVLLLTPYFLAQIGSWLAFYDADRAAHRAAQRLHAPASHPAGPGSEEQPFGGRVAYVLFQLRQKVALAFLPVLFLVAQAELFRALPVWMTRGSLAIWPMLAFGVGILLLGLPLIVRLVLGLQPLPPGALRDRLLESARRQGVGLADILVWNTRGVTANAMIIGLLPWVRYVILSDRLLQELSPEEVQAVFGHELGHARHQHMLFYLVFLTLSMLVVFLIVANHVLPALQLAAERLGEGWGELFHEESDGSLAVTLALLLVYILVAFGLVSRLCERQADVFGCKAVSCGDPGCLGHSEDTVVLDGPPCPTSVAVFVSALDKVAVANGIDRHRPGWLQAWQHGSIASRGRFLLRMLAGDPSEPELQRRLWVLKWGVTASLAVALVWLLAVHGIQ
jgi:Zn-dependent protease with chaperone function